MEDEQILSVGKDGLLNSILHRFARVGLKSPCSNAGNTRKKGITICIHSA